LWPATKLMSEKRPEASFSNRLQAAVQLRKVLPGLFAHVFAQHARVGLS
jgi:hypothetical protein